MNFQVSPGVTAADANFGLAVDLYSMWDKDYLYLGLDITDPSYVPYVAGKEGEGLVGDFMLFFFDPNGLVEKAVAEGKTGAHLATIMTRVIPTTDTKDGDLVGAAYWYEMGYGAAAPEGFDAATGCDKACSKKTDKGYTLEIAIPWANMVNSAAKLTGAEVPAVEVGMTCQMGLDYWNTNSYKANNATDNRVCTVKTDTFANVHWFGNCNNGINFVLAEEIKVETPDAPATADALSFGILMGAVALAGAALVIGKKKAN